ncbi:MAG: sigma-54-dependent Fis family transcriptional regulator, partial [Planctomycetes bacterium]|nr:sigma-54-dependent Fis family transcriptional regulator [Planctomycetota bacterium]
FREDLFYRLNVFPIYLPPLRERKTDILLLADHFVETYSRENRKKVKRISTPAIDLLMMYHWPGNVRELENVIERAVLVCDGEVIQALHLPPSLQSAESSRTLMGIGLNEAVANLEREMIVDALKKTRGNMAAAARILASTERILRYKARKHGVRRQTFRLPAAPR